VAGGLGHLRASHADREQVIALLKVAFVQGRLSKDELDARASQTFAGRTYAELDEVTADLPAGLTAVPPPRPAARVRGRRPVNKTLIWGASGTITPVMLGLGIVAAHLDESDAVVQMYFTSAFSFLLVWLLVGVMMAGSWRQQRSSDRQPPQPPSTVKSRRLSYRQPRDLAIRGVPLGVGEVADGQRPDV
jgi:hypothetical protein